MNTLEFFKRYNKNEEVVQGYIYVMMYIIDTADSFLFDAIQTMKKAGVYNNNIKRWMNYAYKHVQRAMSIVRLHSGESWEEVLERLDGYADDFQREKLVMYNTVLNGCAKSMTCDYEIAKALALTGSASLLCSFAMSVDMKLLNMLKRGDIVSSHSEALRVVISSIRQILWCKNLGIDAQTEINQKVVEQLQGACAMYGEAVRNIMDKYIEDHGKEVSDGSMQTGE